MKTVFIDIETIPDSKKCDLALSRITKEYEREGKSVTAEDVNRHMGTIPQWCSIVGLGIAVNNDPVMSYWVGDETGKGERATEVHLLKMFWHVVKGANHIVGYNQNWFDLNVIKWRTCQLGVPVSRQLYDLKPWEHVSIDVFKGLFPNGAKFMFKLEEVLAHTGIEIPEVFQPALAIDGSMVKELFEAGEIEKLRLYNSLDVWATREITQWGGGVYWPRVI